MKASASPKPYAATACPCTTSPPSSLCKPLLRSPSPFPSPARLQPPSTARNLQFPSPKIHPNHIPSPPNHKPATHLNHLYPSKPPSIHCYSHFKLSERKENSAYGIRYSSKSIVHHFSSPPANSESDVKLHPFKINKKICSHLSSKDISPLTNSSSPCCSAELVPPLNRPTPTSINHRCSVPPGQRFTHRNKARSQIFNPLVTKINNDCHSLISSSHKKSPNSRANNIHFKSLNVNFLPNSFNFTIPIYTHNVSSILDLKPSILGPRPSILGPWSTRLDPHFSHLSSHISILGPRPSILGSYTSSFNRPPKKRNRVYLDFPAEALNFEGPKSRFKERKITSKTLNNMVDNIYKVQILDKIINPNLYDTGQSRKRDRNCSDSVMEELCQLKKRKVQVSDSQHSMPLAIVLNLMKSKDGSIEATEANTNLDQDSFNNNNILHSPQENFVGDQMGDDMEGIKECYDLENEKIRFESSCNSDVAGLTSTNYHLFSLDNIDESSALMNNSASEIKSGGRKRNKYCNHLTVAVVQLQEIKSLTSTLNKFEENDRSNNFKEGKNMEGIEESDRPVADEKMIESETKIEDEQPEEKKEAENTFVSPDDDEPESEEEETNNSDPDYNGEGKEGNEGTDPRDGDARIKKKQKVEPQPDEAGPSNWMERNSSEPEFEDCSEDLEEGVEELDLVAAPQIPNTDGLE